MEALRYKSPWRRCHHGNANKKIKKRSVHRSDSRNSISPRWGSLLKACTSCFCIKLWLFFLCGFLHLRRWRRTSGRNLEEINNAQVQKLSSRLHDWRHVRSEPWAWACPPGYGETLEVMPRIFLLLGLAASDALYTQNRSSCSHATTTEPKPEKSKDEVRSRDVSLAIS